MKQSIDRILRKVLSLLGTCLVCLNCGLDSESRNLFDPSDPLSLFLQTQTGILASLASGSNRNLEITTNLQNGDYPLFLQSGVLDLQLSEEADFAWSVSQFQFLPESWTGIVLRDVVQLDARRIRLFLVLDRSRAIPSNFQLKVTLPLTNTRLQLTNPLLNFRLPSSRVVGSLSEAKSFMEGILLNETEILLVGGILATNPATLSNRLEIYHLDRGSSEVVASLPTGLVHHRLVSLGLDRILIIGGETDANPSNDAHFSSRIYRWNHSTRTLSEINPGLQSPRSRHTALAIGDNRVLISGGRSRFCNTDACNRPDHELLDVQQGTLRTLGAQSHFRFGGVERPRYDHQASFSPTTNQVRFFMGRSRTEEIAEAYLSNSIALDLGTETWITGNETAPTARAGFVLLEMQNQIPLVVGGINILANLGIDTFQSAGNQWTTQGLWNSGKIQSSFAMPPSQNQLYGLGGMNLSISTQNIEVFSFSERRAFSVGNLTRPRRGHLSFWTREGIVSLGDLDSNLGNIEVFGGF